MYGVMELIIWVVLGGVVDVCGAPAVSLSFGGKPKNDSGVVFAYRNGSWVALGGGRIHSLKSSQPKKEERVNYTSELDDLFRRINLTLPKKMVPEAVKVTPATEKPLGELFLEWLSKHEGIGKPAAIKSSPIPVVGLQIDFDESPSARRDFPRVTSYPKLPLVSPAGELPFLFGYPSKKTQKSYEPQRKSIIMKRHQTPDQPRKIEPESVFQKGPNSDDLRTRFYVRKRQVENDVEDPVKFIIEPITISPLQLMNADLIDLTYFNDPESNMTKRHATFSPKSSEIKDGTSQAHLRRQRSYTELLTAAPASSARPPRKTPVFDDALPVRFRVKRRHGPPSLKVQDEVQTSPAAEESYSGQLMVRNEIPGDRKTKLNDLPKYVMKFLSQCKALIEQNYDEDGAKDNYDEDEALLSSNDGKTATDRIFPGTRAAMKNPDVDEFESISINKRPIKKKSKDEKGSIKNSIDDGDTRIDGWAPTGPSKFNSGGQLKVEAKNLLSAYDSDDLYDEDMDWHLLENNQPTEGNINKKMFYTSEVNSSTCRPIFADYAPSTDNYSPACGDEPEVTTLSPMQWKVLMDMLNERLPCPTTCAAPKTRSTCAGTGNTMMTSSKGIKMRTQKNGGPQTTKNTPVTPSQSTRQSQGKCTITTSTPTCTTTTPTCTTTTPTCTTTTPSTTTTMCTATTSTEEPTCSDSGTGAPTEDYTDTTPKNAKQKNKPLMPQRYLIKIETSKPKHYSELSHLQGRSKPNNWFDNIKNLKLLEGLRSNGQNLGKSGYNVLNPKSGFGCQNDPDRAEKMIAEGVIPLKTGSTLNLYISYVLNKTKAHKAKQQSTAIHGNILDDKLSGLAMLRQPLHDSKAHSDKP